MTTVGIDIGRFSIKLAEVRSSSRGQQLVRLEEFPLNQDPNNDVKIQIIDILRTISNGYDPEQTEFVFGVDQSQVTTRQKVFPFRERNKVLKSLAFELEEDIPFSPDDSIFEAKITRYLGSRAEVLAMACPKHHVSELIQIVHDGNLDTEIISAKGLALANTLESWLSSPREESPAEGLAIPEEKPAEVVVHIGHQTTIVLVYQAGILIDVRHLDWGGRDAAEALSRKYHLHYVEALREFQKKAFVLVTNDGATHDQITFSDTIRGSLEKLVHQLNITLVELKSLHRLHFVKGTVTGGTSQIKNIGPYLTQRLEIPFNRQKDLRVVDLAVADNVNLSSPQFGVAVGLALEALKRPKNPATNFLKDDFAKKSQTLKNFWEKWSHTAKIATAALVIFFVYAFLRDFIAVDIVEQSEAELSRRAEIVAGLKGAKATLKNAKKFIDDQKKIEKNRKIAEDLQNYNTALDILNKVSQATPGKQLVELNVKKFIVDHDNVFIEGEVAQSQQLTTLAESLKNLAKDQKIQTSNHRFSVTPGMKPFSYRFRVERKPGGGS